MKGLFTLFLLTILINFAQGQLYRHYDYVGAGHTQEISVVTSSGSDGNKTIDGFPVANQQQLRDASRFLAQATLGADLATIRMTAAMGYEAWLQEQFNLPPTSMLNEMITHARLYDDEGEEGLVVSEWFRTAWITLNIKSPDLLRQKMAYTWSQIMVVNDRSDLIFDYGEAIGRYYDQLAQNSFGNYRAMITDVTYSPMMGLFLSHFNNPKEDPSRNIHPDENYAREIMQLFSIGLWELNPDGSRRTDAMGQYIPTYSNADIKEFAQVFTGLGAGVAGGYFGGGPFAYGEERVVDVLTSPMKMYGEQHDTSEKILLNGTVLPAGQTGDADITQTLSLLSNHPNTAPFISKSLIRFMTTSNPSSSYVSQVSSVFDAAGTNNFQEVIRAILMNPEARNQNIPDDYEFGKLREPMVRLMNYLKAFHMSPNENELYMDPLWTFDYLTGQAPLRSPSVFNFFLPDYAPTGPIGQSGLVGPEFQLLNSSNSISTINDLANRVFNSPIIFDDDYEVNQEAEGVYEFDFTTEFALAQEPVALVEHLDILLANGLLSDFTKQTIVNSITPVNDPEFRLKLALYMLLFSPDYVILK